MKTKPIPTQPYPKLIWYQEKRSPCTVKEREILFNRYYDISLKRLLKLFPKTVKEELRPLAEEKAELMVEAEVNLPTIMKKLLVESTKDHMIAKRMLENSDTFLQWYQE